MDYFDHCMTMQNICQSSEFNKLNMFLMEVELRNRIALRGVGLYDQFSNQTYSF